VKVECVYPPYEKLAGTTIIAGAMHSETRHTTVTAEEVSKKCRCGLETAKKTLEKTTQRGVRTAINPLHRRYRTYHPDLHRNNLDVVRSSDTLFAKVKLLQGNTCAQLYTTGKYTRIMPLPGKTAEGIGGTLLDILNTVGVPREMVTDLASEMVGRHTKFRKELVKRGVKITNAEKGRQGQNAIAESEISQVKRRWSDLMT
jgi:hypothetical protein